MTDPRIASLARDPRTAPVLASIVESGGASCRASSAMDLLAFERALADCRFGWSDPVGSDLLAYLRSIADEVIADAFESQRRRWRGTSPLGRMLLPGPTVDTATAMVAAVLRGVDCRAWAAVDACQASDDLVEAGLLTPDEEPAPLQITPLGRAVLLVLEQRLPPALPEPALEPVEQLLVDAAR